jgi:asparagine N-glycosylation enzyme membrane subunit Stt3
MESIRQTQKKYCSQAMAAAIIAGLLLILAGQKPLGKGLILGTLFSVVNFVLMGELIPLQLGHSKTKTYLISFGSIVIRYGLLALPLLVAVKFEQFNLWTVICGVFMIQIVILVDHVRKRFSSNMGD